MVFAQVSSLISNVFRPIFRKARELLEYLAPQKGIDIDGDQ